MEAQELTACPGCAQTIPADAYFCPNCGKELREKALTVSRGKQIGVYLVSFFLPPFGLYPAIKYIRQPDPQVKLIGWVALVLTILSFIISFVVVGKVMGTYSQLLNQFSTGQYSGY